MATKKEDKKELLIYAGISVPELMLRKGKVYEKIPKLPEEFRFLKDWFVPLNEYPKFKLRKIEELKKLSKKAREALKAYSKKQEVR